MIPSLITFLLKAGPPVIHSGIKDLKVLKTTQSGFEGFIKDQFTTLPEVKDRCFATQVYCKWRYRNRDVDFEATWYEHVLGPSTGIGSVCTCPWFWSSWSLQFKGNLGDHSIQLPHYLKSFMLDNRKPMVLLWVNKSALESQILLAIMILNGSPNFHDPLLFIDEISSSQTLLCSQNHMEILLECMSLGSALKGSDCRSEVRPDNLHF